MTKDSPPERVSIELSSDWEKLNPDSANYAVWIGHATYLINNGDLTILTDPIFSEELPRLGGLVRSDSFLLPYP